MCDSMQEYVDTHQYEKYVKANVKLHLFVVDKCGNDVLADTVHKLYQSAIPTSYTEPTKNVLNLCVQEHRDMIECFRTKDTETLKQLYYSHWVDLRAK